MEGSNSEARVNHIPNSFPMEKLLQPLLHSSLPLLALPAQVGQKLPLPLVTHQTQPRQQVLQTGHAQAAPAAVPETQGEENSTQLEPTSPQQELATAPSVPLNRELWGSWRYPWG